MYIHVHTHISTRSTHTHIVQHCWHLFWWTFELRRVCLLQHLQIKDVSMIHKETKELVVFMDLLWESGVDGEVRRSHTH